MPRAFMPTTPITPITQAMLAFHALPWRALLLSVMSTAAAAQTTPTAPSPLPPALPGITLDAPQQAALGVRTLAVRPAAQQALLASATVTVLPGHEVTVAAPFAGVMARLDVGLGDSARAGARLAAFSSPALAEARRQLREAELEARNAQAALQRDQTMHDEGIIPNARLQITRNRQQAAEANWQALRSALQASGLAPTGDYANGQLLAPRAGTIVEVSSRVGERFEAGTVLFRIADLRQLQLDITVSSEKAAQLRAGDAVDIPSHQAKATLLGINRSLDASQQARARARVTVPGRLQAGEALQVQLQPALDPKAAQAWQVPARAVFQMQGHHWVLVATDQGFMPTAVQVLGSNDEQATVQGPLKRQQRVATTGLAALRPLLQPTD